MFNTYIYQPIFSVLVLIYEHIAFNDFGVAVIILTILVRIILFPIFYKGAKSQTIMQRLQPKIKEIQEKHKKDKEKQAKAMMDLYRENKFNPFSSFFLLILQLPVFFALFRIFTRGLSGTEFVNHTLFGIVNLGESSIPLAILAAGAQYLQGKLSLVRQKRNSGQGGEKNPTASIGKTMMLISPIFSFVILLNLPSALGLYWFISTLFSVFQQLYINKKLEEEEKIVDKQG